MTKEDRDILKRVQDEEQLPSPQPKAKKALEELKKAFQHEQWLRRRSEEAIEATRDQRDAANAKLADLKRALLDACDVVEYDCQRHCGIPSLRTAVIRKIIKENT